MKKILILLLIIIPLHASSLEFFTPLSQDDINLELAFTGLVLIDWAQTKTFRGYGRKELNPALGPEPTQIEIDQKIAFGIASHWFLVWVSPQFLRPIFQYVSITFDGLAIYIGINKSLKERYKYIDTSVW